jgi:membrane-associated phospholipid phosphatase
VNIKQWKTILIALVFLLVAAFIFIRFLEFHEARVNKGGWMFNDPIHPFVPIYDVSLPIFSITYGSVLLYFLLNYKQNHFLARLMIAYGFIIVFRMITMSLVPLKEPDTLVHLEDPFLNNLIYPGRIVTDLFFSGHTAFVFAISILSGKRFVFLGLTILMGVLVMVQRVHYSIDVLAAIPFSWLAAYLTQYILARWANNNID